MTSIAHALLEAQSRGLDRLDAQLLLLHALGRPVHDRAWLLAHDTDALPPAVQATLDAMVQRRSGGEPLAYITGHKEFFGLDLQVDARVLVPRPDTETLVEWALAVLDAATAAPARPVPSAAEGVDAPGAEPGTGNGDVLDLGTGSGAVALALKHARPTLRVSATDASADALQVAQANARRLRLAIEFIQGSWLTPIKGRYHAIVSNPPYIAAQDRHLIALTHEPLQALASGDDGLDDIRLLIAQARAHLHPGGWLLLEHGYDQAGAVRELLSGAGFEEVQSRLDLGGIERCSGARAPRA
ncbi:MAG: peptide chain release factor N(5)-glutamine methyltransferase [Rhodoferax sp.]|nr:peptide chain release factor N(5)-glutamine methyltransferase [Rhodoferax sp.]